MNRKKQQAELAAQRLKGLSPIDRLEGGYSVVSKDGRVIKEISVVKPQDKIQIDVTDGTILATVQEVRKRGEYYGR